MGAGAAVGIAFLVITLFILFVLITLWYMRYKKVDVDYVKRFHIKFSKNPEWGILRSDTVTSATSEITKPSKRRTISYSNPSYEEYVDANANIQKDPNCIDIIDMEEAMQCKVSRHRSNAQ